MSRAAKVAWPAPISTLSRMPIPRMGFSMGRSFSRVSRTFLTSCFCLSLSCVIGLSSPSQVSHSWARIDRRQLFMILLASTVTDVKFSSAAGLLIKYTIFCFFVFSCETLLLIITA